MRCTTARELLLPYVDGALAVAEGARLEQHLRSCDACRGELERTRALAARLDAAGPDAPVDVDAAWLAFQERLAVDEAASPARHGWWRWWLLPVPVAAAAGVALAVALAGRGGAPELPDEVRLVQHLDLLEQLDCLVELPTLESAGLLDDPAAIERALEEVGG